MKTRVIATTSPDKVLDDPIRQWIHGLVGVVVGADEALHRYDRQLLRIHLTHEVLERTADLGADARELLDPSTRT